jgi:hypothetical protein
VLRLFQISICNRRFLTPGLSAVYRCPVPTKLGFGGNGGGSGWGEAATISKFIDFKTRKV